MYCCPICEAKNCMCDENKIPPKENKNYRPLMGNRNLNRNELLVRIKTLQEIISLLKRNNNAEQVLRAVLDMNEKSKNEYNELWWA